MNVTALVDRFGSNRMHADMPAALLRTCKPRISCVNVPFAGGMCEIAHFEANVINVNDLDLHVINLANVVRDRRAELVERLDATPFHPEMLKQAQECCRKNGQSYCNPNPFDWAYHYFVASWMTRGGKMGTKGEFEQGLSVRWKAGGGDSVVRFRSATEGIAEWQQVMRKCTFHTLDCFDFLGECKKRDIAENAVYADPPWPDDGDNYTHKFTDAMQRRLAGVLTSFEKARVVVRYGDHPLIRELYPEDRWTWRRLTSRTQANKDKAEVLLTNFK